MSIIYIWHLFRVLENFTRSIVFIPITHISAFVYLLEECKKYNINKVVYAKSSSIIF